MKVTFDWALPNRNRTTRGMDWDEVPSWARQGIEKELDMEDGAWPEVGVRHLLVAWDVGITFSDPTPEPPLVTSPYRAVGEAVTQAFAASVSTGANLNPLGDLERAILLVKSNGFDVTKQPQPGMDYVRDLMQWVSTLPQRFMTTDYEQAKLGQLVDADGLDAEHDDIEIYVEVDRSLLYDTIVAAGGSPDKVVGTALWTHLWPVIIRVDEGGDIVLHATSGERVLEGTDDVSRFDQKPGVR